MNGEYQRGVDDGWDEALAREAEAISRKMEEVRDDVKKTIDMLNKDRKAEARHILQKLLKRIEEGWRCV